MWWKMFNPGRRCKVICTLASVNTTNARAYAAPEKGTQMPSDHAWNGMPASDLSVTWTKSRRSNPNGNCVEMALLPAGDVAVRNSRYPGGPALIFTRSVITAFLAGIADGEFADLAG